MTVIVGMIATSDGAAISSTAELSPSGRGFTEYRHMYTSPAVEYRSTQPAVIPVDRDHGDRVVGQVRYLALRGLGLFGVLEVDEDTAADLPDRFHLSAELEGRYSHNSYHDIELSSVALVDRTAMIAQQPATVCVGDLATAHCYWANPHRTLLAEAAAYHEQRRFKASQPHHIAGAVEPRAVEPRAVDESPRVPLAAARRNTGGPGRAVGGRLGQVEYSVPHPGIISVR
jgi:hypothetical protein